MPYEYREDVAAADIGFRAWDPALEGLFVAAADATLNIMVEELDSIRPAAERKLEHEHMSLDMLLFNFLQDLIYYKDAERLLLRIASVEIQLRNDRYTVLATGRGEQIDPGRHRTRVDVKAVTLHHFSLKQTDDVWEAFVILDI